MRFRKRKANWVAIKRLMGMYWPQWRESWYLQADCGWIRRENRYTMACRPYMAYFVRRGFYSGPPSKLAIFRRNMDSAKKARRLSGPRVVPSEGVT